MPTPYEYRQQADECLLRMKETNEWYVNTALLELAVEFQRRARKLECVAAFRIAMKQKPGGIWQHPRLRPRRSCRCERQCHCRQATSIVDACSVSGSAGAWLAGA